MISEFSSSNIFIFINFFLLQDLIIIGDNITDILDLRDIDFEIIYINIYNGKEYNQYINIIQNEKNIIENCKILIKKQNRKL